MGNDIIVKMPEPSTYGAVELKKYIKKYTIRGFIYTVVGLLAILLLLFVFNKVTEKKTVKLAAAPISKIQISAPPPDATQEVEEVNTEVPQEVVEFATIAKAGNPVPVPDAEVADLKEFASFDQLSESLSRETGTIVDLNALPTNVEFDAKPKAVEVKHEEVIPVPDMDEFVALEQEPSFDSKDLARNIVYPDVARRAGIEGRVLVSVWVDKTGRAKKVVVRETTSNTLNNAAVEAVKKTTFTPGIQNKTPVACWVLIPVVFKLK